MKKGSRFIFLFIILKTVCCLGHAQDVNNDMEQQLESLSEATESETEDDTYLQLLHFYASHPLNINKANVEELQALKMLTPLQVQKLVEYRQLLGSLMSLYELQAVPLWDVNTIHKLLPYISIIETAMPQLLQRFTGGMHEVVGRYARVLEKGKGFNSNLSTHYAGNADRIMVRYKYKYQNVLQYGVTADKDAGERLLGPTQPKGFDFYSFHLFARQLGNVKAVAIGDYTINMGQGLVQWQSLAFKKGAQATAIVRQSPVLRPYSAAGEFNFYRGAAATFGKGKVEATFFASSRRLSANLAPHPAGGAIVFTSFNASGLHRTSNELEDKNSVQQTSFGGNAIYKNTFFKIGLNGVQHHFSKPLFKREAPYNLHAIQGQHWFNGSLDYTYNYKNLFFFGEAALDERGNKAFLKGLLASVDAKADIALLYRNISAGYQSLYGNAYTENTLPSNEKGVYTGITLRPAPAWRLDAYADMYQFPWLKYRVDAPGSGKDYLVQLNYAPHKTWQLYARYRNDTKSSNEADAVTPTHFIVYKNRESFRLHSVYKISMLFTLKARTEWLLFDKRGKVPEEGFLTFIEGAYRSSSIAANLRLQYFETGGYNSRLYAYESDVLYSFSTPAFFDKGFRYYLNISYDIGKSTVVWLRLAQTLFHNKDRIGSGLDEIEGNKKTELKMQIRINF